jgi:hypothetical protein
LALGAVVAVALVVVSGGSDADPRTPARLPGLPPPFLGTAVTGSGGLTAAIDAYGDVADLRAPGPAGRALIDNPDARQAAGTVAVETGIVPRLRLAGGAALPPWRADSVSQRYLPDSNVVRTTARFGPARMTIEAAVGQRRLALVVKAAAAAGVEASPAISVNVNGAATCRSSTQGVSLALICMQSEVPLSRGLPGSQPSGIAIARPRGSDPILAAARAFVSRAAAADRARLAAAKPLGRGAPTWAGAMYRRSLLTLRALTSRRTGAVAAGARDGWAHVWPRDAATACLAFAAAGYREQARAVARYLGRLDLTAAARFDEDGGPVAGRGPQGDAGGWVAACEAATGRPRSGRPAYPWRGRPDYQEGAAGEYLGNAIAAGADLRPFATPRGLVRRSEDPGSGLDSAAAWGVRPFPQPALFAAARHTLLRLAPPFRGSFCPVCVPKEPRNGRTRFGITPGEGWDGGVDPWSAPTAWTAWAFAALADAQRRYPRVALTDRRHALRLLADLRRAATPAGSLPERVDAETGLPRSTTPLLWTHAFAILALLQLWPGSE